MSDYHVLLEPLRKACAALPALPATSPYRQEIEQLRADLQASIDLAAEDERILERFDSLLREAEEPPLNPDADPELKAAWQRMLEVHMPDPDEPDYEQTSKALFSQRLLLIARSQQEA